MRLRFRTALVTITLSLLLATVAVIGVVSLVAARDTAEELSAQVLTQSGRRIADQVHAHLQVAIEQATLDRAMLATGKLGQRDKPAISGYFLEAIQAHPQLSFLSWTVDETGDHVTVERSRDGALGVTYLDRTSEGKLALTHAKVGAGGAREITTQVPDKPENDGRGRPYYLAAKAANAPTWTETYVFLGGGKVTVPGVTRATPVHGADGKLAGVLTADFDLYALSEFLAKLEVGAHGMAFLMELRADGEKRVIAHPELALMAKDPKVLAMLPLVDAKTPVGELARIAFEIEDVRYLAAYQRIESDRGLHWVLGLVQPEADILGGVDKTRRTTIIVTLISTAIATLLAVLLAMQIGRALRRIAEETEAIGKFHLLPKPVVLSSVVEVAQLGEAIEDMKAGLRSFQKFVPADLVRSLVETGNEVVLGGARANVTMHFSDIADFTTISETMAPEELVVLLSEYLSLMAEGILESDGTIDKYIGDAIMAFWNAPKVVADHAFVACRVVLENQAKLAARREVWTAAGKPALHARVGLHTGDAVVGNIGSDERLQFTAIGDTVNLAARLEGLNKTYGTYVLISGTTYELVKDRVVARLLDRVAVKGKSTAIAIYELIGLLGEVPNNVMASVARHESALEAYFAQKWDEAEWLLGEDDAAKLIKSRIAAFRVTPPPADWDGVHRMTSK